MRTNLSSQISLNRVSPRYYRPGNAVERSVLTRLEKIPTNIFETSEEGVVQIANEIVAKIQDRQREGKFCTIAIGTGASLRPLFTELIRKHKDEGVSFRNVVFFNLYEYYPLTEGAGSSFSHLNKLFLSQIDIDRQNIFTMDGSIPQEAIIEHCRLYEQRIQTFGGLDMVIMGIGREGNIGMNEPGSHASSTTRLILIDATSRSEAAHNIGVDNLPPCSITMGINTIMGARKVYMLAWGEDKADIIRSAVEDKVSDTLPASYLQLHANTSVCVDLAAAAHLTRIQRPWLVTSCEWNDKLVRTCVQFIGLSTLPQKHSFSTYCKFYTCLFCFFYHSCLCRIVYAVSNNKIFMEHGFVNQCKVVMRFHTCKCSVCKDICVCDLFSQFVLIVKAVYAYFAVRYFFCKLLCCSFCSFKEWIVRIKDRDGCCSVKGTLYSKSCSCSTCSKNYHLFAFYVNAGS